MLFSIIFLLVGKSTDLVSFVFDKEQFMNSGERDHIHDGTVSCHDLFIIKQLQFFVELFIEGASVIDFEDPKWDLNLFYKNSRLVGFATSYRFLFFPDSIRMRISQFLIFPPFQKQKLGTFFYGQLADSYRLNNEIMEITGNAKS